MNWFLVWLFMHILAAVIAFGPVFVFPIIGTLASRMPQHKPFAVEHNHRIELRLVIPPSLSMFVSGVGLIWTSDIHVFQSIYLLVSIILYMVAVGISIGILLPTTQRLVHVVDTASQVREWLPTIKTGPSSGMFSRPRTSARR